MIGSGLTVGAFVGVFDVLGEADAVAVRVALGFVVVGVIVGVGETLGLAEADGLVEGDTGGDTEGVGLGVPGSVDASVTTGAEAAGGGGDDVHPATTRAVVSSRPGNRTNRGTQGSLGAVVHIRWSLGESPSASRRTLSMFRAAPLAAHPSRTP
jgi:hypothetical protein